MSSCERGLAILDASEKTRPPRKSMVMLIDGSCLRRRYLIMVRGKKRWVRSKEYEILKLLAFANKYLDRPEVPAQILVKNPGRVAQYISRLREDTGFGMDEIVSGEKGYSLVLSPDEIEFNWDKPVNDQSRLHRRLETSLV